MVFGMKLCQIAMGTSQSPYLIVPHYSLDPEDFMVFHHEGCTSALRVRPNTLTCSICEQSSAYMYFSFPLSATVPKCLLSPQACGSLKGVIGTYYINIDILLLTQIQILYMAQSLTLTPVLV